MKVCIHCFNDEELKQFIITNSTENGKCDYCNDGTNTDLLDIGELLDFFAEFIAIFKIDPKGIAFSKLIQNDWNLFLILPILSTTKSTFLVEIQKAVLSLLHQEKRKKALLTSNL